MMKNYRFILLIPFFILGACSSGDDKSTQEQSEMNPVFNDQIRALEKAKDVEKVIQYAAEKRRKTIEEQDQ